MNERIRELVKQANGYWEYGDFNIPHSVYFAETDLQKFAELIVRECVEQGKLIQSQTIVDGSEEYIAGRAMGIEVFMNQIKQHFGVEESKREKIDKAMRAAFKDGVDLSGKETP
jgi:hypothetical protein